MQQAGSSTSLSAVQAHSRFSSKHASRCEASAVFRDIGLSSRNKDLSSHDKVLFHHGTLHSPCDTVPFLQVIPLSFLMKHLIQYQFCSGDFVELL